MNNRVFARFVYEPLYTHQEIFCADKKELNAMIKLAVSNRIWFDVDFPDMALPTERIVTRTIK